MKVGYQHIIHEVSLYQKNNIWHCGNNQQYNQMIMTAIFHVYFMMFGLVVDHLNIITTYQQEV